MNPLAEENDGGPSARAIAVTANLSGYHQVSAADQCPENVRHMADTLKSPDSDNGLGSVDSSEEEEEDEEMDLLPAQLRDCGLNQEESVQPGPSGIHSHCPNHSCVSTSSLSSSQLSADANRDEQGGALNTGKVDIYKKSPAKSKTMSTAAKRHPLTTAGSGALSVQPSTSGLKKCSQHSVNIVPSTAASDSSTAASPQDDHQDLAEDGNQDKQGQDSKYNKNLANIARRRQMSHLGHSTAAASLSTSSESNQSLSRNSGNNNNNTNKTNKDSASSHFNCSSDDNHTCPSFAKGNTSSQSRCPSEPLPCTSTEKPLPTCDTHSDDPGVDLECLSNGASYSSINGTSNMNIHNENSSSDFSPSSNNPVVGDCTNDAGDGSLLPPSSSSSSKGKCLRSGWRKSVKSVPKSKKICDSSSSSSSSYVPPTFSSSNSVSSAETSNGEPTKVNQSCQAVSEEIRETTRKAKENEEAGKASEGSSNIMNGNSETGSRPTSTGRGGSGVTTGMAGGASTSSVDSTSVVSPASLTGCRSAATTRSGPRYNNSRKAVKRKMNTCDQATSTSDPVHEEDHVQVLGVQSKTLTTLTLHMVGITDLYLSDCPSLTTISCSACRVLKKISIGECPKLSRISFAQCKKLLEDQVVKELSLLSSDVSRVLFLRPMHQMQIPVQSLFSDDSHSSYHCLVKDHCKQPSMMVLNRKRAEVLVDLLPNINKTLREILKCQEQNDGDSQDRCQKTIHHFEELNEDGSLLEVKTDIPWLQFFLQNYSEQGEKEFLPSTPMCEEFANIQLEAMAEDIVKDGIQGDFLADSVFLVYINMCDISGMPTPDLYV